MADVSAISPAVATILGAVVGLTGGITGGLLTVWHQRRLEQDKAINARADALTKELSGAVQQLTISIASSLHSMCWLTWLATVRPDQLTQLMIDKYDDEQHTTLPKILGYLATTAALDTQLYELLRKNVDEIFMLDAEIGAAGRSFKEDASATATKLAAHYAKMTELERQLPRSFGDILGARLRTPRN